MNKNTTVKQIETSSDTNAGSDRVDAYDLSHLLLRASRTLASCETLDEMLEALMVIVTDEADAYRCTVFLSDPSSNELYSRVAVGKFTREIRIPEKSGVAGYVFTSGKSTIVHDAYSDDRFDKSVDEKTGFKTESILCTPIKTVRGDIIGVAQVLNKRRGRFTDKDLETLNELLTHAAIVLQSTQVVERMKALREEEQEFFKVVSEVVAEIDLGQILNKVMSQATKMINCNRTTLFLNDERTNELFSQVGEGLGAFQIRLPNTAGIAGTVFTSGDTVNIPHAYADLRFNPAFDKQSGFFTRSILCVPVVNKENKCIGVTQALNKKDGPFTDEDEFRLKTFTAQVAIALENAQLFNDVQNEKNRSQGMLESMSSGVIALDEKGVIATCNKSGLNIFRVLSQDILKKTAEEFFTDENAWIMQKIKKVGETQAKEEVMEAEIKVGKSKKFINLAVLPLVSVDKKKMGTMIMVEDVSENMRMQSTMARHMGSGVAEQLMAEGEEKLKGKVERATVLFSDIRGFTTLTEKLGAKGTVALLNEYFTIMVECIDKEHGWVNKFIGDAIMAGFGVPIPDDSHEDRAVRAAVAMLTSLYEWNDERKSHGKTLVDMGIGVNTDMVVTGNIGSSGTANSAERIEYTMIGDGVNLAARLETACKQYSARIIVSEYTYKSLRSVYSSREIDLVVVKGKTKPVTIYEILDYHTDQSFPNLMDVINQFKSGLVNYRKQLWDKAIDAFKEALKANAEDKLSDMYIARCLHYKANPPGDDWDGVWVMKEK
ncbi:GAF domain-containing protein [Desulfococcaceae bacterium HSG7]|nr:GAF domain-containing protein [Desulfococcaceae bacterium HSG9]MDM8555064.1 GAF domain-containing protein [Desulfococcaceae bacterium HSG7]